MADKNEMTPEQAILFQQVYVPAFVEKCAELGTSFDSESSLEEALETAALVKMAMQGQTNNLMKSANQHLKKALGVDLHEQHQAKTASLLSAAKRASQDPSVRKALLANVL